METWLQIGAAWAELGVVSPVPMSGYAARTLPSTRTADLPPRASAVAFGDEVLVVLDVVAVDAALVARIRERVPGAGVQVAATHTHAGPGVLRHGLGMWSPEATVAVVDAGVAAAHAALADRRPCSLEWLTPTEPGVAVNRRRGVPAEGAPVKGLRWLDASGAVAGSLLSYPCHPTALGPRNRELSGDYPGFVRQAVEDAWGGVCVFATGCAGDINTGHSATASFSLAGGDGRTIDDAVQAGVRVAASALAGSWTPVEPGPVRSVGESVALCQVPREDVPSAELAERWAREREADPGLAALLDDWIAWAAEPGSGRPTTWIGHVSVLALGEVRVLMLPGEPFLAAARYVDTLLPRAITLGYVGDCPGYLPSIDEYPLGGYEVDDAHRYYRQPAPFAPGVLERVTDTALALAGLEHPEPAQNAGLRGSLVGTGSATTWPAMGERGSVDSR